MKCTVPDCNNETEDKQNPCCDSCKEKGWTANFEEMSQLIANDPLLAGKVQIVSPIQSDDPQS